MTKNTPYKPRKLEKKKTNIVDKKKNTAKNKNSG